MDHEIFARLRNRPRPGPVRRRYHRDSRGRDCDRVGRLQVKGSPWVPAPTVLKRGRQSGDTTGLAHF
jgi:hypothetical protein